MYNLNDIYISKDKEIHVPNKESIISHIYDRTHVAAKCELYINCSKTFRGKKRYKKRDMTAKQEIIKDHRCEGTYMAYKCKIFMGVNNELHTKVWPTRVLGSSFFVSSLTYSITREIRRQHVHDFLLDIVNYLGINLKYFWFLLWNLYGLIVINTEDYCDKVDLI